MIFIAWLVALGKSVINVALCRIDMLFDHGRIPGNDRVTGYIKIDVRIRRDKNIVANDNLPYYDSPGADKNLVADLRTTRSFASIFLANGHDMSKSTIIPKFRPAIYDNGTPVANIKPLPYPGIGWYLKPVFVTVVV